MGCRSNVRTKNHMNSRLFGGITASQHSRHEDASNCSTRWPNRTNILLFSYFWRVFWSRYTDIPIKFSTSWTEYFPYILYRNELDFGVLSKTVRKTDVRSWRRHIHVNKTWISVFFASHFTTCYAFDCHANERTDLSAVSNPFCASSVCTYGLRVFSEERTYCFDATISRFTEFVRLQKLSLVIFLTRNIRLRTLMRHGEGINRNITL